MSVLGTTVVDPQAAGQAELVREQLVAKFNARNGNLNGQANTPGRLAGAQIATLGSALNGRPSSSLGERNVAVINGQPGKTNVASETTALLGEENVEELSCCQKIMRLCCPCFVKAKDSTAA